MRRDQLEHAIRTACQIIEHLAVVVVGSQSILGTFTEDELPSEATMSLEIDILPLAADNDETARLADLIEGIAGEWSSFEEQHGFSIDGVDLTTVVLPEGWRDRLIEVQNANTAAPAGQPRYTGWCLDKLTCASPSCARCARRTRTSSPRSSMRDWSMPTSSPPDWLLCRLNISRRSNGPWGGSLLELVQDRLSDRLVSPGADSLVGGRFPG